MNKLFVLLVAVLLAQAALAKRKGSSSSSDSSDSSSHHHKKNTKKVVTVARPCPACPPPKILIVKEATVCEGERTTVTCPVGSTIQIHEAFYGRRNSHTCRRNAAVGNELLENCSSPNAMEVIRNRCNGRRECVLTADNAGFIDQCKVPNRYIETSYSCTRPE